jgi:hypothetical protein
MKELSGFLQMGVSFKAGLLDYFRGFAEQLRHQRYLRPPRLSRGGAHLSIESILV